VGHRTVLATLRRALLGTLLVVSGPVAAAEPALTTEQRTELERGGTVVLMVRQEGQKTRTGVALRVLEAPPERVFQVVVDHRHYPEFMPFVTRSDPYATGNGPEVFQRLDLPFPLSDRFYRVRSATRIDRDGDRRVWSARWSYVPGSGNVAANEGSWTLTEHAPGRTLVEFRIGGYFVPHLPAFLQDQAVKKTLPWILDGLAQQVRRCRYDVPRAATCAEDPPGSESW
jgi:ribosome-associated toxin RatA of RatAB toxin-antitoxin module